MARSSGSSHSRPGRVRRRRQVAQQCAAARRRRAVERREAALREERPRRAQRPPQRRPAADRDHLRAGAERVQPLRRRRHPGADDRDARRVLVRLVGVHGCRMLARPRETRDGPSRRARARTARRRRARSRRRPRGSAPRAAATKLRSQPLRSRTSAACETNSSTSRVVAVRRRGDERAQRARPHRLPHREARERGRGQMPVRLGAHPPLPDARRALAPDLGRVGVRAEDADLLCGEPAVPQGGVRGECRQPAADDGTPRRRVHRYFTEPASRP